MKLLYTDTQGFNDILNQKKSFPLHSFLREGNKIVVISNYISIPDSYILLTRLNVPGKNFSYSPDSILYLRLGEVFQFLGSKESREKEGYISNYSVGYFMEDLINAPLYYYAEKYGEINAITFYRSNYYSSVTENKYDFNKLYQAICEVGGRTIFEHDDVDISFSSEDLKFKLEDAQKGKPKKKTDVLLVRAGTTIIEPFEEGKRSFKKYLQKYLEQGNFLAMFEGVKNKYGIPFAQSQITNYDTYQRYEVYEKISKYFNSLNIEPDQVISFMPNKAGINMASESFHFGLCQNNLNQCIKLYMSYINDLGFKVNDIYTYGLKSRYIMPDKNESFDDFLKNKVLQKKLVK